MPRYPGRQGRWHDVSYFFPMAAGDYAYRIFGSIDGLAIDETYTSSTGRFSAVLPRIDSLTGAAAEADTTDRLVGPAAVVLDGPAVGGVAWTRRHRSM